MMKQNNLSIVDKEYLLKVAARHKEFIRTTAEREAKESN